MKNIVKFAVALFIGIITGAITGSGWVAVIVALLVYLFWGVWNALKKNKSIGKKL